MQQPTVLYLGAGRLAQQVATSLPEWTGWSLRRSLQPISPQVQPLAVDFTAPLQTTNWPQQCPDYLLITLTPQQRSPAAYQLAYLASTKQLLQWLSGFKRQPKRIIFVSSTGVYDQQDGQKVDELSTTAPQHFSGQTMLAAEQLLFNSGIATTAVRLAGIYGGQRQHFLQRVAQGWHADGCNNRFTNRIHEQDAAALLAHLLRLTAAGAELEPIYLGVDDEPAEQAEVVTWLQQKLLVSSKTENILPAPSSSKRCSNALARLTGWQPRFASYREGYSDQLLQLQQNNLLS